MDAGSNMFEAKVSYGGDSVVEIFCTGKSAVGCFTAIMKRIVQAMSSVAKAATNHSQGQRDKGFHDGVVMFMARIQWCPRARAGRLAQEILCALAR